VRIGAADFPDPVLHVSPGPAFDVWLMLMRRLLSGDDIAEAKAWVGGYLRQLVSQRSQIDIAISLF
jgi:hypothetical protein